MISLKEKCMKILLSLLACCMLSACGQTSNISGQVDNSTSESDLTNKDEVAEEQTDKNPDMDTEKANTQQEQGLLGEGDKIDEERLITDQTFTVTLNPLGEVVFASYKPNIEESAFEDVIFTLERDGQIIDMLSSVCEGNIRSNETFKKVEAVSFPDYNSDGYEDIIIICSYIPLSKKDVDTEYSEIRIYGGTAEGNFTWEQELSTNANDALAEKTISSVLGFLGVDRAQKYNNVEDSWKQAYIDYVNLSGWEGIDSYDLIYVNDDDIPELVEIGNCEAAGCRIVNYANDKVYTTQLRRLNFTYIERENLLCNSEGLMDHYYDIVYSLLEGKMTLIAEGYYGIEDDSNNIFDMEGNLLYQYEWNGKIVNKTEYEQELNTVYDVSKAKGYNYPGISQEEIIEVIQNF